jgi:segregation and condensation protein A
LVRTVVEAAFQLCLPNFDGSLALLLRAAEQRQLDITTVSLAQVAAQCLTCLREPSVADPVALADFIAISARLLLLKSRGLLSPPTEPSQDGEEPPTDVEQALCEYRQYAEIARGLGGQDMDYARSFPRLASAPASFPPEPCSAPVLPALDLVELLLHVLARQTQAPPAELPGETITVREKIEQVLAALERLGPLKFWAFMGGYSSRLEIVVCFFAVLHLIKDGRVNAVQLEPFGDILLERNPSR